MHELKIMLCKEHGTSTCYQQRDGTHMTSFRCTCPRNAGRCECFTEDCPIDLHRIIAALLASKRAKSYQLGGASVAATSTRG